MKKLIDLKIGRVTHAVTDESVFVDNGATVQLITDRVNRYGFVWVVLTKKGIKEISKFKRNNVKNGHGSHAKSFTLLEQSK